VTDPKDAICAEIQEIIVREGGKDASRMKTKDLMWMFCVLAFAGLAFADSHYWHSWFTYEHYDALTGCELDGQPITDQNTGNITSHFKCKEGEITLTMNWRDLL
jgi:hypothetical protein